LDLGTDTTTTDTTTTTDASGSTTTTDTTTTTTDSTGAVISGDLTVSLNPSSLPNGTQIPKAGIIKFGFVDFSAAASDISLSSLELVKSGLANVPT